MPYHSRSSNGRYVPRPPPATPEQALERPQTCMVVTTRERRIEDAIRRAKTPVSSRRRHLFTSDGHAENLYVVTTEYPSKFSSDTLQEIAQENNATNEENKRTNQTKNNSKAVNPTLVEHPTPVVKERAPTPWKPPMIESESTNSSDDAECTVVTNGSNLRKESSIVSEHHVVREYSFRRSSHGSTNEILVTSEQEFCLTQEPTDYSNEDIYQGQSATNTSTENIEGHAVYMTSDMRAHSLDKVAASPSCQGQNNNRCNINMKHKAQDPFQNGPGIVREKTIIATTIASPRTPLRRVKLDLESDSFNVIQQYPLIGDDFTAFPRELILSDEDDYSSNVSADDEDTISDDDPEISSLTYPSSPGSVQDNFDIYDRKRSIFSTPSRIFRNIKEFFSKNTKMERGSRANMSVKNRQKAERPSTDGIQLQRLMRENTTMASSFGKRTFLEKTSHSLDLPNHSHGKQLESENIEEEIVGAIPREASQDDGILSVADTISQGGRSSAVSPSLESAPPSAMKKRGSTSRSGSVKKQKVQFDMDVEVHLVPRDAYDLPAARRDAGDHLDSVHDTQQLEDDCSSQISNDVQDREEETNQSRDGNRQLNAGKIRQHGPSVPFRVIKRETPTGGGRRGRRNSYDLIQKTISKQFQNHKPSDSDRRNSKQVHRNRTSISPLRTPHSSYYHSRENHKSEDARLLTRASAMSPEHFVAFYSKQQQLKQYLDHERRLRRQQLFNGNMRYQERQRKVERANSKLNDIEADDSDSDSGASVGDHLPRVQGHVHDPPLPQPRPYIQREPAGGRRRFLTEDERSRISSGYGGSASEVDGTSLPSMTTQHSGNHPFTQRQVAEVMRASGLNKGRSPYLEDGGQYDELRNMVPSDINQNRHEKAHSEGGGTYSKLSVKAKQALQQAHLAYTSSLNEMMPVGKGFPRHSASRDPPRMLYSQRYPTEGYNSQQSGRYIPGQSKGKSTDMLARNRNNAAGHRIGSAHVSHSSYGYPQGGPYPIPPGGNRSGTSSEAIHVNTLGLSARLPLTARRSAHRHRSNTGYGASQPVMQQSAREYGDPYRRLTSGNKSPYLKSQLSDDWTRKLSHSLSEHDSLKYRSYFNNVPAHTRQGNGRNLESLRSGPPQLRRNRISYAVSEPGAQYTRRMAPRMVA